MSGDPVEESAVAVRTGFIQAMQTAAMTANMIQRRGAESRSVAEFERRAADGVAKEGREAEIHSLKVDGYLDRDRRAAIEHTLETQFKQGQQRRADELHELNKQLKTGQMQRGDVDFDRRNTDGILERANKGELHGLDKQWRGSREQRAKELHELDREYKQLLVDARRRALGLSETLAAQDPSNAAANHAAAEFAAAHSNRDLSAQHAQGADAYAERFTQDTGHDSRQLIDEAFGEANSAAGPTGPTLSAIRELTAELTADTYREHLLGTEVSTSVDQGAGVVVADAVEAAGLTGHPAAGTVIDEAGVVDLDVGPPMLNLHLDHGLEP